MATSQITAAATSGRYMSDLGKSVSPALKLMKVLTTATDASEMPIAAGIPSSRTRPDVCRMNSWVEAPPVFTGPAAASLLATGLPPRIGAPGRGLKRRTGRHWGSGRAAPHAAPQCLGSDKQL